MQYTQVEMTWVTPGFARARSEELQTSSGTVPTMPCHNDGSVVLHILSLVFSQAYATPRHQLAGNFAVNTSLPELLPPLNLI